MKKVVIVGAAGRDFHDFNTVFRGKKDVDVVAFTAAETQNLGEVEDTDRSYPPVLAGDGYPEGIPIVPESELESLIEDEDVDEVVFSYSDVSHRKVMHVASKAVSSGADFRIIGRRMMLESEKPVIAVDAARTGSGKSQLSGKIAQVLDGLGREVAVVREPMPYGDLEEQEVQRFEQQHDLGDITIEEREEYEQHLEKDLTVFSGVDYGKILERLEQDFDTVLWDGGNNELPFYTPDIHFVVYDALRPEAGARHHPGEANLRMADYVVINKENTATEDEIKRAEESVRSINPDAEILHADSVIESGEPGRIKGKKVLAVEDGPTMTHGGMGKGAAALAAEMFDADSLVDPRETATGSLEDIFEEYGHLGRVLPAMGYSDSQLKDLRRTIEKSDCELVLSGTPVDLGDILELEKPVIDVDYRIDFQGAELSDILASELNL